MVEAGELAMGHARAIAGAADPEALARRAVAEGLSVRAVEKLAAGRVKPGARHSQVPPAPANDPNIEALEQNLADSLGMPVALAVTPGGTTGSLTVRFADLDQLDWLCARLGAAV
jgi:ParB family transcriptional regulator, chromosome partitioning protein